MSKWIRGLSNQELSEKALNQNKVFDPDTVLQFKREISRREKRAKRRQDR